MKIRVHLKSLLRRSCCVCLALPSLPVSADEFFVPTDYPTLQEAVAAAAASPPGTHHVVLTTPVVTNTAELVLGPEFTADHRLVIRPA